MLLHKSNGYAKDFLVKYKIKTFVCIFIFILSLSHFSRTSILSSLCPLFLVVLSNVTSVFILQMHVILLYVLFVHICHLFSVTVSFHVVFTQKSKVYRNSTPLRQAKTPFHRHCFDVLIDCIYV